mgnify:CR=1 FL=1
MKILVLNCGSSSLKFQLINMENNERLAKGNFERIGGMKTTLKLNVGGKKEELVHIARDYDEAISFVLEVLLKPEYNIINSLDEITAVGHRIVHGGEMFSKSVLITEDVIKEIEKCIDLAPLHNPAGVAGIKAAKNALPNVPMVAVFDTSFHQTMPEKAFIYQLPYKYYEDYKIRKYGFHGISHRYVANRISEILGRKDLKVINCHLGQGASLCAIKDGKSVDTTMGLTPLAGVPMGTRCGDVDPSIIPTVMKLYDIQPDEMLKIMNKESGAWGVSGVSTDFRDIEKTAAEGDERSILALESRAYIIAQYIAKFIVTLNGVDVITFAGGIGENGFEERERICGYLECFGIKLDKERNLTRGEEYKISSDDSKVDIYIVPTNEEIVIAEDAYNLTK